ncbi:isochorismate synthase MenF [Vibrio vulnificus]|uniref:isochorismate synthase n=1 Tax=Vibrio vulnificus TaxID=672 RepID=UPI001CDB52D5|nr:isochorismate synthase MenF [Vibrio vulnificus]MCA3978321.1 isochorismate synthase MenF [Vibrio vulnificus]MCA4005310.1 isochorismate synthase MenF [Vibrio vulnificus]MDS1862772.1 isochorismate synthase MenF [Vibrio vulnificus]HDY7849550.1 isochorismate synthase MenF [Vibrio vulnificus]HDY8171824.1 isochorismate synthase MenF [Vibrio vulnificus]
MYEVVLSHFHQAITNLIERVKNAKDDETRLVELLTTKPTLTFIDWLEAQPVFPKFYWQSRDTREEVVALGQLHTFVEPGPAYTILSPGQRVWGGRSFDGSSEKNRRCMPSFFFLPQIELIRLDDKWSLAVNLNGDKSRILHTLSKLTTEAKPLAPLTAHIQSVEHLPEREGWCDLVSKVLKGIQAKAFKKVVLARKTTVHLDSALCAAQLLKASYLQNHHSFHFMLSLDSKHSFIGSTPERLYLRQGQELYTEALAGTIGRGHNATQDMELASWLSQDVKNLNENQYVVDDIVDRLTPHAASVEVESEARLVRLRKVQHLKRNIHAQLKTGVNGVQLLSALQPTAAVAGLPRQESMQFIVENEPFARGWYAGSVGYISHEQAEFCVAIRSALIVDDSLHLFAGAGIVPGSIAEHEWSELDKKMSTLLSLISEHPPLGVAS